MQLSRWLAERFTRAWRAWQDPSRAARRLYRDALAVVESAAATSDAASQQRLRGLLCERLEEARQVEAAGHGALTRLAARYQAQHRDARNKRDMDQLTVLTLAIIHLRAGRLGPVADAARDAVEQAFRE